jgi:hypothetical protein
MNTLRFGMVLAFVVATNLACGGDDDDDTGPANVAGASGDSGAAGAATAPPLEIIGEYDDSFMGEQIITADDWNGAAIVGYDNDANVVYTQLPDDDMFNPSKFTKTVYTEPKSGSFYFCQVEFSLDTLADAQASEATADDSNPDESGCGGTFPWTKAIPK